MISFCDFFKLLNEGGRFRESKKLKHEQDYPMFSIFTDRSDPFFQETSEGIEEKNQILQNAFWAARRELNKIGFPSMHANVIFRSMVEGRAGEARGSSDHNKWKPKDREDRRKLRHMVLNSKYVQFIENNYQQLVDTIIHEWSHLWMFNHGLEFRRAMDQYHEALINSNLDSIKPDTDNLDYDIFYGDLYDTIANYQKTGQEIRLSQTINNALEDTLEGLGPYYKHIPQNFIEMTSETIVGVIRDNIDQPTKYIEKLIRDIGIEHHISEFLKNNLKLDPERLGPKIKEKIAKKVNYPSAYGLQDSDETFAVAIEKFDKLDPYHKKRILELMQIR